MNLKGKVSPFLEDRDIRKIYGDLREVIPPYFEDEYDVQLEPPELKIEDKGYKSPKPASEYVFPNDNSREVAGNDAIAISPSVRWTRGGLISSIIHELGHAVFYQNSDNFRELREDKFGDQRLVVIDEGIAGFLQRDGLKYLIGRCAERDKLKDGFLLSETLFIEKAKRFIINNGVGIFWKDNKARGRDMFLDRDKSLISQAIKNPEGFYTKID